MTSDLCHPCEVVLGTVTVRLRSFGQGHPAEQRQSQGLCHLGPVSPDSAGVRTGACGVLVIRRDAIFFSS